MQRKRDEKRGGAERVGTETGYLNIVCALQFVEPFEFLMRLEAESCPNCGKCFDRATNFVAHNLYIYFNLVAVAVAVGDAVSCLISFHFIYVNYSGVQ